MRLERSGFAIPTLIKGNNMNKTFVILNNQVTVTISKINGNITSSLGADRALAWLDSDEDEGYEEYAAAIDAVESIILSHACAGVDIESAAYQEGINTTLEAIGNNY